MKEFISNKESFSEDFIDKIMEQFSVSGGSVLTLIKALSKKVSKNKAEVHFSEDAFYKMQSLIAECDKEIGWDGFVYRDKEKPNVFYVTDIVVFPQQVTGATVDTEDEAYMEWMNCLTDEEFNHRRFNGHSHVKMSVSPSGTDINYRNESIKNVKDFFIYGIFNKSGECNLEVYDVENNIVYENKDIVWYTPEPDWSDWAKKQISEKLTEKKFSYNSGKTYGKYGYGSGQYGNGASKTNNSTKTSTTTQGSSNNCGKSKASSDEEKDREKYLEEYFNSYYEGYFQT